MNRLKVFYRSTAQWFILVFPLLYVIIQLFIAYTIIITVVTDDGSVGKITEIFFTFYFTFFLVLGQALTASLYSMVPMFEKKAGLRQMMHMSGLSSFQYFLGLFLGDILLFVCPAAVISIALIGFEEIMVRSQIGNFFLSFTLFGMCLISFTYVFSHVFDDPETSGKYMALIFVLGMLFGPIAISMIFAAIFGFDDSVSSAISIWYFIDPIVTFVLQLFTICCTGKPDLDSYKINIFKTIEPTTGLYCGVMIAQIIVVTTINFVLDNYFRNKYRKRGGIDGDEPPMLEVRNDVIAHE